MNAADTRILAAQYKISARLLLNEAQKEKNPTFRAPYRLCAIHAIELYLSAFLTHKGVEEKALRKLGHGLKERADLAVQHGLVLKDKTRKHLADMDANKEYLMTRYDPRTGKLSALTRIAASLQEVGNQVEAIKDSEMGPVTKTKVI